MLLNGKEVKNIVISSEQGIIAVISDAETILHKNYEILINGEKKEEN